MKFTSEQISFMKKLGLQLHFESPTDTELVRIEDVVGEKMQQSGLDKNNGPTADGRMCESILDLLA